MLKDSVDQEFNQGWSCSLEFSLKTEGWRQKLPKGQCGLEPEVLSSFPCGGFHKIATWLTVLKTEGKGKLCPFHCLEC